MCYTIATYLFSLFIEAYSFYLALLLSRTHFTLLYIHFIYVHGVAWNTHTPSHTYTTHGMKASIFILFSSFSYFFFTCLLLQLLLLLLVVLTRSFICLLVCLFVWKAFTMLFTLNSYYSQWEHYVCAWPTFVSCMCICKTHLYRNYMQALRIFSTCVCLYVLNNRVNTVYLFHIVVRMYAILLLLFFFFLFFLRGTWMFYLRCLCAVDKQFMRKFLQNFVNRT